MRVDQVVDLWRRQEEGGTAGLAEACKRCLAEDDRLRHQAAYRDPRWWRGRIRDWQSLGQSGDPEPERASPSAGKQRRVESPDHRGAREAVRAGTAGPIARRGYPAETAATG